MSSVDISWSQTGIHPPVPLDWLIWMPCYHLHGHFGQRITTTETMPLKNYDILSQQASKTDSLSITTLPSIHTIWKRQNILKRATTPFWEEAVKNRSDLTGYWEVSMPGHLRAGVWAWEWSRKRPLGILGEGENYRKTMRSTPASAPWPLQRSDAWEENLDMPDSGPESPVKNQGRYDSKNHTEWLRKTSGEGTGNDSRRTI